MEMQAAAAAPPTATIAVIHDLIAGGVILIVFIALFAWRHRKAPATGTVVDVFIDSAVIAGALSVLWRVAHQAFVGTLSAEEHIIIAIGCVALSFVLSKRLLHNFAIAWSKHSDRNREPSTEDSYH